MSKNILKEKDAVSHEFDSSKYVVIDTAKIFGKMSSPLHKFDTSKYVVMDMPVKRDNITGKLVRNDSK